MDCDIYNPKAFKVDSLHLLEHSKDGVPFRWSEGIFKIKPIHQVKNVCLNFTCIGENKNIIIFLENEIKNIKYERILKSGEEYILAINTEDINQLTFYITPNLKTNEEETRTLGLYIKKIYTTSYDVEKLDLISINDEKYKKYINSNKDYSVDLELKKYLNIPFIEQNKNLKFLNLQYSKKNFEFNSSIFKLNDKKYIITRNSRFVSKRMTVNGLKLYEYYTLKEIPLNINEEVEFEQMEDPRVLVYDDKIYVSCATYIHDAFHLVNQKMLVFDKDFNHIDNIHFKYGYNGKKLTETTGKEKNWTFFVHENKLMCIYALSPHTVLEFDWDGNIVKEYITHNDFNNKWRFGVPRGGTNPVLYNNFYYSFFHSHVEWGKGQRCYFMGKYKFNSNPPFEIVDFSLKPILWGNEKDDRIYSDGNPLVVFPCGVIIENNKFLVSLGINDEKTAVVEFLC